MLVLALFALSKKARAEAPALPESAPDVVVTGTRTPELSQRATVKTDVVTAEEAERRGATNVAEALETQRGVRVDPGAYGFLGNVSPIQIQGFDLQRVLVLEDGEPIVGDIGGAIDLAALPLSDVKRIEIVRGPTSALYGSSAIGGVVNILTAPPEDDGPSGRARVEGRSHRGLLLSGKAAYLRNGAWVDVDTRFYRQDGIARVPGIPDLQVPETSRFMVGVRGGTLIGKAVDVRLRARFFRDRTDGLSSQEAPGVGRYALNEPADTHRYTLHAITRVALGRESNVRVTLGRQWVNNTTAITQENSAVGEEHHRKNGMQSAEAIATLADGDRTWVFGGRGEFETFEQTGTKTESLSTGLSTAEGVEVPSQNLATGALYGQLAWKLGALTILPGVRGQLTSRYGSSVTPRLALSYQFTPEVQARVAFGRGFRAPSAKELGFLFDHSSLGYRVIGNPDLSPETSWGGNADVSYRPDRRFVFQASAFGNWVKDLIDIDVANGVPSSGGAVDYRYTNFGKARTFGGSLGAVFRASERFRSELAYDYLWTKDDASDEPLSGRPPHTLTASIRATLPCAVEGYVRGRATTSAFVTRETQSPGYETVDLRLSRKLGPLFEAALGVLNVTDVHQDAGRVGDLRPPLGRVFYAAFSAVFPGDEP